MPDYILSLNGELQHHGVKGMKWGKRKKSIVADKPKGRTPGWKHKSERQKRYEDDRGINPNRPNGTSRKSPIATVISKRTGGELTKRGKAAIDVLINGDKDWMGRSTSSDNVITEARNRGKAAIERLLYSQEQIDNKKFFGRYDF